MDKEDWPRLVCYRWHIGGRCGHVARWDAAHLRVWMHHEVLRLPQGNHCIDHENRDPLDNRKSNLRPATPALNAQNQGSRGGSSEHRGVHWCNTRKKWVAQAELRYKKKFLGRFHTEEDALAAVSAFRAKRMPFSEDARLAHVQEAA